MAKKSNSSLLVRKQILIGVDQNAQLASVAIGSSRSEGEIVREALSEWLAKRRPDSDSWKVDMRAAAGMWQSSGPTDADLEDNRRGRAKRRDEMASRMRRAD